MAQITITINNNKVGFFLELIKYFDFIKVKQVDNTYPNKVEIKESIKQGLKEVELIEQGKLVGTPLNDFLNEL